MARAIAKMVIIGFAVMQQEFPEGTQAAGIRVSLIPASADVTPPEPVMVTGEPYQATFQDVVPGSYTVSVQAISRDNQWLGEPVTDTVLVPDDVSTEPVKVVLNVPALGSLQVSVA